MPDTEAETQIEISVLSSLTQIDEADWDACACPEATDGGRPVDPFTTWRFLRALEVSDSVGPQSGWQPQHLVARRDGIVIATAPLYAKGHSQGEYIFDHNWAHAYERAGGRYYPKLQMAVPFTPATGRRFLTRPGYETTGFAALAQAAVQLTAQNLLSSLHITFCTEQEAKAGAAMGFMTRASQQFHWKNHGYGDFETFLGDLSSRKRKNIRKERQTAQSFGGEIVSLTGDEIQPGHWDAFWHFYQDTGARKWGTPYLTRRFFDEAYERLRDDTLMVLAQRGGRPIAGALNFIGRDTLYGRYWGCVEDHSCLHFELCYYRAIDFVVANGMTQIEAGAQGDHKLARGYMPVTTHSLHWVRDEGFRRAVQQFLDAERAAIDEDIEIMTSYGPFNKTANTR